MPSRFHKEFLTDLSLFTHATVMRENQNSPIIPGANNVHVIHQNILIVPYVCFLASLT